MRIYNRFTNELIIEVENPKIDLSGADLSYANLYGADLYDADLCNANLRRANLSCANLRRPAFLLGRASSARVERICQDCARSRRVTATAVRSSADGFRILEREEAGLGRRAR